MNERIKQLWEDNDTIEVCYPEQGSPVSVSATTLEKFAELIVRECMGLCYRIDTEYEGKKVKSTVIASKVAEHFGVEK